MIKSHAFSSEINVWKNPSSARCRSKVSSHVTMRMSIRSSRWAFSDTSGYKLNLAITAWASFCALSGSGQALENREGVEYPSLPSTATLSQISKALAWSTVSPPHALTVGGTPSEKREPSRRSNGVLISSSYGADIARSEIACGGLRWDGVRGGVSVGSRIYRSERSR